MAIRETALSGFVDAVSSAAGLALETAQASDNQLQKARQGRNASDITFSVGVGSNSGVSATIDAIGFEINKDNLDDVPDRYALNSEEQTLFRSVLTNLETYEQAMRKNLLSGLASSDTVESKEQVRYTREKMRLYHLGKAIIQPMDEIHILLDGGTRKLGETGNVEDQNEKFDLTKMSGALNVAGNILGLQNENEIDDELLEVEWRLQGQHMKFKDFKILRTLQGSGEGGTHIFGGLVHSVSDRFNDGFFKLSVSCRPNIEWLKLSNVNQSPSLKQVQGIIYDPLTPFKINTDPATGLPIGKPELLDINKKILNGEAGKPRVYFPTGSRIGNQVKKESDMEQDVRHIGGNIINLYQHAPGLVYRWKPGIMTTTYDLSTTDPKDGSFVDYRQLRREIGQLHINTPFDGMDSANIISLLVTGFPYDIARFVLTSLNIPLFSIDSTYNDFRGYFNSFLDIQRSLNFVQGNFAPFKPLNVSLETLAETVRLQRQLQNSSSKLQQIRTQKADLQDKINRYSESNRDNSSRIARAIEGKLKLIVEEESRLSDEILESRGQNGSLTESSIYIAGNDISFDFITQENEKLFGDRLRHAVLRRREDIIRGRDTNYLIISDEYDKDYDIQAFILKMKEQRPELWKSGWNTPYEICRRVAETLNFEFFTDTQGHLVFRPPQYNRTPASVLNNMFSMEKYSGIGIIPDFLKKLFKSREESLITEITNIEWEIILNGALLGYSNKTDIENIISDNTGNDELFIHDRASYIKEAVAKGSPQVPQERKRLKEIIDNSKKDTQLSQKVSGGAFDAVTQVNLQKDTIKRYREEEDDIGSEELYNTARNKLSQLRGLKKSSIEEYDKAKVGASRNGQKNPNSDIARIISKISDLVSSRSRLILVLGKLLDQNIEIADLDESGKLKFSPQGLIDSNYQQSKSFYNYLIEDDTKNVLGHLSGERFIIKDEDIISASFEENPPEVTAVEVNGTDPIIGAQGGTLAGHPIYSAFGADFDLWRQYGWRKSQSYDKPFFWSAEQQCAPYAVMLLSRQRKNIVTGTVTIKGNEYYQLGDVVYITHRNMLYYVEAVKHNFSYGGRSFNTTLTLKYGHAPGEYIPTPLDVIGKGVISKGRVHTEYRIRRDVPAEDTLLGVIHFDRNSNELLKGSKGKRNFEELKRSALTASTDINKKDISKSSRIYIISFDSKNNSARVSVIRSWFNSPSSPIQPGNGPGLDGILDEALSSGGLSEETAFSDTPLNEDLSKYQINDDFLQEKYVNQIDDYSDLTATEKELIRSGLVADQKTFSIDNTLKDVIEIRLKQPPIGGWKD